MAEKKQEQAEYKARKKAYNARDTELRKETLPIIVRIAEAREAADRARSEQRRLRDEFKAAIAEQRRAFKGALVPLQTKVREAEDARHTALNEHLDLLRRIEARVNEEFPDLAGDGRWTITVWRKQREAPRG